MEYWTSSSASVFRLRAGSEVAATAATSSYTRSESACGRRRGSCVSCLSVGPKKQAPGDACAVKMLPCISAPVEISVTKIL